MKRRKMLVAGLLSAMVLNAVFSNEVTASAKTVSGKISSKMVRVGKRIKVSSKTEGASFSSSNSVIASVDEKGIVTGKKEGKVTISVKKSGYKKKSFIIHVKKSAKKPEMLPVSLSEVSVSEKTGKLTNKAKKGRIKKVVYTYSVSYYEKGAAATATPTASPTPTPTGTPTPTLANVSGGAVSGSVADAQAAGASTNTFAGANNSATASTSATADTSVSQDNNTGSGQKLKTTTYTRTVKNVGPGKTKTLSAWTPDSSWTVKEEPKVSKIELYTGKALYVYDAEKNSYSFQWATKDKTAPKFHGLIRGKSVSGHGDAYRTYYSDKKGQYNFKQFVSATDDRDSKVKITADTSKINWNKSGMYKIYYHAKDAAGNKATTWAKVQVIVPGSAESAADQVLRSVTRSGWSDEKKARAIYAYVKGHMSYVHNAAHIQWRSAGLKALRYQSGDCYIYYATCRLLLTRAGIPNVMINRYPVPGGRRHFWNLTYVSGGWYHFDTTPRRRDAKFCLWTDSQLWAYSSGYTFRFNASLYPARATKRIS